ncbi:MAG: hypothetical protein RIQ79_2555 [Verrucomicrobiota bacterium]
MTRGRTLLITAVILVVGTLAIGFWLARPRPPQPRSADAAPSAALPPPPALLPVRVATPEHPLQSWERLLAADGTPREDLAALADLTSNYLQSVPSSRRPAVGFNEDLARVLTDRDALGDSALPATHPALVVGRLVDRWGTPWQIHPLAADVIQLRSAGPDRKLYTPDDLVTP